MTEQLRKGLRDLLGPLSSHPFWGAILAPVSSTTETDLEGGLGGGRTLWPPMSLWAWSGGGTATGCVGSLWVSIFTSSEWLEEESTAIGLFIS